MAWTEEDLRARGFVVGDGGRAVRVKEVMPPEATESNPRGPAAETGVTHLVQQTRPPKYHNRACYVEDQRFDSKREAEFWMALRTREAAGEIHDLQRQVAFDLCCPTSAHGDIVASLVVAQYIADFTWCDREGRLHIGDAKGVRTQVYRLKAKWMNLQHGIAIEEL